LGETAYPKYAKDLGLDHAQFLSCSTGDEASIEVRASAADALALEVAMTPTLFLATQLPNGMAQVKHHLRGAATFDKLQPLIDSLLAVQR
jgi:predicted DsbA family dithiol-disulfide isomerase